MQRSTLKEIAKKIAEEAQEKTYEYWVAQDYPISYDLTVGEEEVIVDIELYSKKAEYIQLGVCVSHPIVCRSFFGIKVYTPECYSAVIRLAAVDGTAD